VKKKARDNLVIAFMAQLSAVRSSTEPHNPVVIKPERKFTFTTSDSKSDTIVPWGVINAVVRDAQIYTILDLSDCTAEGDSIGGSFFPGNSGSIGGNDMNVIWNNPYIKGIILPSTLKVIGGWAFHFCFELACITIPASVESIRFSAFWNCYDLASITFGRGGIDITTETAFDFNNRSLFSAYRKGGAGTYTITEDRSWLKISESHSRII
jgi:hypothetical protein